MQDPDWPEEGYTGMDFQWFCRQIKPVKEKWCNQGYDRCPEGEDQLWHENGDVIPDTRRTAEELGELQSSLGDQVFQEGGCFGGGPGALNISMGMLTVKSEQFVKVDVIYEVLLQLR